MSENMSVAVNTQVSTEDNRKRSLVLVGFAVLGGMLTANSFILSYFLPGQTFAATFSALFGAFVLAMPIIVFLTVWKNFGHTMVILLAGIQSISPGYYEAATVEGATAWKQFSRITLPLLLPNIAFCVVTNLIGSMQVFDQVYVATRGGPLFKTETIVQYIYSRAFNQPYALGYASSIATVLFVIIMTLSLSLNSWFLKREEAVYQ